MRLAAARKLHRASQSHLAALLGISLQRYTAWEHAHAMPNSIELYLGLCRCLGVTVDWLFFGDTTALPVDKAEKLEAALASVSDRRATHQLGHSSTEVTRLTAVAQQRP